MEDQDVDFELLPDAIDEVREHLPLLEHDLHQLVRMPGAVDLVASAFRHMHTIKGDFAYCRANRIAEFVHRLEDVLQCLRARTFECSALVAEALLQSMDQVGEMMQALADRRGFDEGRRLALSELIEQLARAKAQPEADDAAREILTAAHDEWLGLAAESAQMAPPLPDNQARALALGQQLAAALAERHPAWHDRAAYQLKLVLALNRHYRRPCHPEALTLAVHWHDVALLAAPERVLGGAPLPGSGDWLGYIGHPARAAEWLLTVAPDCEEAALIVRQHHQWANGKGFPPDPARRPLHPGAQMLACADLVYERVSGLGGEEHRRGVLRAVFEVNGGLDTRFDAALINAFQAVARELG